MNIIDVQDQLKNFSENQLIKEMQMPSGNAPQFLVLSEIQRRKRMRDDFTKQQAANEPTVAEEAVAAAGVPMQGIAGMSEAMAPQSAVSEGIGTIMPQSMRQTAPAPTPAPEDMAMGMAEGGLLDSLFKGRESLADASKRPEIRTTKDGRKAMYKPGTNIFLGFVSEEMAEGGVVKAQKGAYFPSNAELYGLYGQESGYGKNMYGSSGEIGPLQIMPTTAIQPGYGIKSLFPELQKAVERGDYESALAAYQANKAMVDEALMSGQKVEPFVMDYLDKAEAILGNRDLALLSYNQGISGTKGFEGDPSKTDYVSGVMGNQSGFADLLAERGVKKEDLFQSDAEPNFMSAMAATPVNQTSSDNSDSDGYDLMRRLGYSEDDIEKAKAKGIPPEFFEIKKGFNDGVLSEEGIRTVDGSSTDQSDIPLRGDSGLGAVTAIENLAPARMTGEERGERAAYEASLRDDESETDDKTSTTPPASSNEPIKPPAPTAPKAESEDTSIEAEILKMQEDLKKGREQDKWLAIAQAGLALMSSKEPTLLGAAGEAGVSGLKAYREAQDRYQEGVIDLINARAKLDKSKKPKIAQKDILDAQIEIMKDPLATPTDRARAKAIADSIVGGAGFGLVKIPQQAAS